MNKILIILSLLIANQSNTEETAYMHQDVIIGLWDNYIDAVDNKKIQEMFSYFYLPATLHFDQSDPVVIESEENFKEIFNVWKDSPQANFHHTERENITVNEIIEDFSCVADVVCVGGPNMRVRGRAGLTWGQKGIQKGTDHK